MNIPAHQSHSRTSREAASMIRDRIGPLHRKILAFLENAPNGACDERLGEVLDIPANTLRPRRRELEMKGLVEDSGRTEPTRSGRAAVMWIRTKKVA